MMSISFLQRQNYGNISIININPHKKSQYGQIIVCSSLPQGGQDRLRLNNGKKKKDFLVIVFGLHYLCIEFAVFGLLITLQNQNSS